MAVRVLVVVIGVIAGVGVSMLPLAIDVMNALFPSRKVSRATSTIIQPILLTFVFSLSGAGLYFFFAYYLPYTVFLDDTRAREMYISSNNDINGNFHPGSEKEHLSVEYKEMFISSWRAWTHTLFAIWAWINVVYNFAGAVLTNGGTRRHPDVIRYFGAQRAKIRNNAVTEGGVLADRQHRANTGAETAEASTTKHQSKKVTTTPHIASSMMVCRKDNCALRSSAMMPPRLFFRHCKVCGTCTAYMDHHCPFTGNCVGAGNFIYFYLFLGYCSLGLLYALVLSSRAFLRCIILDVTGEASLDQEWCRYLGTSALICLPVAAGWFAVSVLFAFHSILLLFDRTTVQFCRAFRSSWSWFSLSSWREALGIKDPSANPDGMNTAQQRSSGKFWELKIRSEKHKSMSLLQVLLPIAPLPNVNSVPPLSALLTQSL